MPDDPFPDVLDMRQVAAKLGKSHSWLKDYLRRNPFGRKIGAKRVFTPSDYAALLNSFPKDTPLDLVAGTMRYKPRMTGRTEASARAAYDALLARLPDHKPRGSGNEKREGQRGGQKAKP